MRRRPQPKSDPIVPAEILEQAKLLLSADRPKAIVKCSVCGGETAVGGAEPLCWVCRRLKISAWKEIEQPQMPAQE